MDEMKQTEQSEFPFIREKIVGKKRGRVKRLLLFGVGVVVCAMIFGVVSRLCFVASEPVINRILGISPSPVPTQPVRNHVELPSRNEAPTAGAESPDATVPTQKPSQVEISQGEKEEPQPGNEVPSGEYVAGIADYVAIYQEIRRVATNAASAMATITVTTERTDWFEQVYEESTTLSGVIVGDNGVELLILTEASQLMNSDSVKVTVGGYTTSDTVLYAADEDYNLAVIGIDYASIPAQNLEQINYAMFGESQTVFVGTPVIAIGNPNGYTGSFELGTVTARNSYAYVADNRLDLFNTSIPDYANGTGVIINTSGEVIGLITHSFKHGINQELNTVIGISKMKPVIVKLVNRQKMNFFGVVAEEITESLAEEIESKTGIRVTKVISGSPAEDAGIREGDIILSVNEEEMSSILSLRALLDTCEENEFTVKFVRKGQRMYTETEVTVTVREK